MLRLGDRDENTDQGPTEDYLSYDGPKDVLTNGKSWPMIRSLINPLLHNNAFWGLLNIMYLKIFWKMEHLLFWSKCSIFYSIYKGIQNLIYIFLEFFQCCLKIVNDVIK